MSSSLIRIVVGIAICSRGAVSFSLTRTSSIGTRRTLAMQAEGEKQILNKYSRIITEPPSQGASQAMLYATGLTPETIALPQVGICSVWFEGNPCNMHLMDLSGSVKQGDELFSWIHFSITCHASTSTPDFSSFLHLCSHSYSPPQVCLRRASPASASTPSACLTASPWAQMV